MPIWASISDTVGQKDAYGNVQFPQDFLTRHHSICLAFSEALVAVLVDPKSRDLDDRQGCFKSSHSECMSVWVSAAVILMEMPLEQYLRGSWYQQAAVSLGMGVGVGEADVTLLL